MSKTVLTWLMSFSITNATPEIAQKGFLWLMIKKSPLLNAKCRVLMSQIITIYSLFDIALVCRLLCMICYFHRMLCLPNKWFKKWLSWNQFILCNRLLGSVSLSIIFLHWLNTICREWCNMVIGLFLCGNLYFHSISHDQTCVFSRFVPSHIITRWMYVYWVSTRLSNRLQTIESFRLY